MMKRTLTSLLALAGMAVAPVVAQQAPAAAAAPTGKIHGKVLNPVGAPQTTGTVSLSTGSGDDKYSFPVDATGSYTGDVAPGTYTVIYRAPDTPKTQAVDHFENVKVVAGQDIDQDFDMSRPDYIKSLTPEMQKQIEEIKKKNSSTVQANEVIKQLNGDLATVSQDIKDAEGAQAAAVQQLGAGATKEAIISKTNEIRTAKYSDVETLMTKDSTAKPDAAILWARLGQGQLGLKKFDDAETSFKKALDVDAASKKPNPEVQGLAQSGLGEAYARTGKVDQAATAYDAAAKANPTAANIYLKNQAVIYFQMGNATAQVTASDKAIAADPNNALLYYLKAQGLVGNATVDPKTQRIVLPAGCAEAYQKYLELDPNGPYSADAKGILEQAGQKISSTYKAGRK